MLPHRMRKNVRAGRRKSFRLSAQGRSGSSRAQQWTANFTSATARAAWLTSPILPVTGAALASLRPGKELSQDAWQFATPDLLSAFSDWQKAVMDIQFQETQLKAIRELNESKIDAQQEVVARMEKLVAAGTDTQKDLVAERTNLIQYKIQGRKDIHEAETNVEVARRTEATLARQLQQAGLEPTMLRSAAAEGEIVVAEVPERLMDRVKLGMTCEVRVLRPAQPRVYREGLLHLAGDLQGQARAQRAVRRERPAER